MKKNTISVLLAVALMLAALLAIGASAEEAVLKVDSANVAYNDKMHLVFTLENTESVPDGAEAGIVVWDRAQETYTVANARYATFTEHHDGSVTYYKSYGIAAKEIDTKVYIAAAYLLDGAISVTQSPIEYGIVEYMISRLNGNVTEVQARLYYNVLAYGLASDAVLGGDLYTLVNAKGGYVGSLNRNFAIAEDEGASFILRAQAINAGGEYFIKWVDEDGNTVSTDRTCSVTPEKSGTFTYTAVFGTKANSPYRYAVGFDTLTTGVIDFGTPDLSVAPADSAFGSYNGTNYKTYKRTLNPLTGATFVNYYAPLATKNDTTDKSQMYTYTLDENGNYIIDKTDIYTVIETAKGDKAIQIQKIHNTSAWDTNYTPGGTGLSEITFDLGVKELTMISAQTYFTFRVNDGKNTSNFRINVLTDYKTDTGYFYAEMSESGARDENTFKANGEVSTFSFKPGESVSIKAVFNNKAETPCVDLYANGVYAGSMACTIFAGHKAATDYSKAMITYMGIGAVSNTKDLFFIDNVTFR